MRVLNAEQMREADRRTIEDIGIPSLVLMENAGQQVVLAMERTFDDLDEATVAVVSGRGNNGGDGFVVARVLWQRGIDVLVCVVGSVAAIRGDARVNVDIIGRLGIPIVEIASDEDWELHASEVLACDVIVDAMFGTGLAGPLGGLFETIVADLNAGSAPVVAIDLPSGLSAEPSTAVGPVVEATLTVTLAAPKLPLVMPPSETLAGSLVVADIGIPRAVIDDLDGPRIDLLTQAEVRKLVPVRGADAHKGTFGHVWIVAGSRGRTGAAHLSAMGALRSGAGLVTVGTPASCVPVVASMGAEYMTEALAETPDGRIAAVALDLVLEEPRDVIAAGPGIGTGPEAQAFVLGLIERTDAPLVLDADALTVLCGVPDRLRARDGRLIIITPHPGEMARLVGASAADVQHRRIDVARDFARAHQVFVVLKGHRTLVATPGGRVFINPTGNPGMATGGSGDVLTGVIAGWLAQLGNAEAACQLGVYLHGAAGDLAAADDGEAAMVAGDILRCLGDAALDLTGRERSRLDPE